MFAKEGGKYVDVLYAVNEYKTDMNEFQFFQASSSAAAAATCTTALTAQMRRTRLLEYLFCRFSVR